MYFANGSSSWSKRKVLLLLCFPSSVTSLFGFRQGQVSGSTCRSSRIRHHDAFARVIRIRAGSETKEDAVDEQGGERTFKMDPVLIHDDQDGTEPPRRAIILMDGFCRYHGMYLASRAQEVPGTAVIPVLSNYLYDFLMATQPENAHEFQRMRMPQTIEQIKEWKGQLPSGLELVGVYCESDSGLADAETLRKVLNTSRRDDPDQLEARRNKFLMQEWIRTKTDLPVVQQKLCETLQDAQEFASGLFNDAHEYVVVKPYRGVASESVHLCRCPDDIAEAYRSIIGSAVFGSKNQHESVLVQEFLSGQEYAVDVVSRDGDHKIAAIWRYDKRPANGASFCYFQTRLVDAAMDAVVEGICRYVKTALTALGVRHGLSHNEIIVTSDRGPMLVEVNCRQHNMDFAPLTMACVGYNALDLTLVSFLGDEEDWDRFPDLPVLRGHGCMVHLVNYATGTLKQVKHLDEMSTSDSFLDGEVYEYFLSPGTEIKPTIDIRSDAGWVQLINESEEDLVKDYEQIVEWMPSMFEVE